jgi:hypothetical protein
MTTRENKYETVLNVLKNSKPSLDNPATIAENVLREIREEKPEISFTGAVIEFFFGWVYIGWVRRSMIAVTMVIFLIFGYQQTIIMKRIKELSSQRIETGNPSFIRTNDDLSRRILLFRLSKMKIPSDKTVVTHENIDEMIGSLNSLRTKYKDLIDRIENDPELKKYVEQRMDELAGKELKTN